MQGGGSHRGFHSSSRYSSHSHGSSRGAPRRTDLGNALGEDNRIVPTEIQHHQHPQGRRPTRRDEYEDDRFEQNMRDAGSSRRTEAPKEIEMIQSYLSFDSNHQPVYEKILDNRQAKQEKEPSSSFKISAVPIDQDQELLTLLATLPKGISEPILAYLTQVLPG